MKRLAFIALLAVSSLSSANIVAVPAPGYIEVTRDTFGIYEQCMNDHLKRVYTTTKENVKLFDQLCIDTMQKTPTYKVLDLNNQSAVNQRTLKFRAELMEVAK